MKLETIIKSRKSTYPKDFNGEKITNTELEELLWIIPYTPNHKKTEPWRFQVFQNDAKINLGKELARLYQEKTPTEQFKQKKFESIQEKFRLTPVVISIILKKSGLVPEWEEVSAVSMAVQNLWLKATEMNLGGYWSSPKLIEHMDSYLNLNPEEKCLGFFYLGKPKIAFEEREKDWRAFVEFII